MKIAVVGAGSMGSLFGALLVLTGEDVCLVDVWQEHVDAINSNGLVVVREGDELEVNVRATSRIEEAGVPDLIIIFVKSYHTAAAAKDCCRILGSQTVVLTLQNGIGNVEKLAEILGRERVIAGTTSIGCTGLGPGRIKLSSMGEVHVGDLAGQTTVRLENIANTLRKAEIATTISSDVERLIWNKLLVNVGINALTAITGLKNGELLQYAESKQLMTLAVEEAVAVAGQRGIDFSPDNVLQQVFAVAEKTSDNRSSMLQDLDRGIQTEIDVINGAVVAEGTRLGVPTPVNQMLLLLIKTLEQKRAKSG